MSKLIERGQSLIEYALLIVFIAVALILVLSYFGISLGDIYSNIITTIGS